MSIDRGDIGIRIDRVLLRHLAHIPGVTRTRIQRLIASGSVHINGRPAARAAWRTASGDVVAIELPVRKPRVSPAAEAIPLSVLYEDEDLLIVNKPAGQVSHPAFRNATGTLLNGLLAHAAGRWAPSLVSRLDKGTSGLVLVAKSGAVQAALQRVSQQNGIEKDYLAVVSGKPPARGTIDLALDRDPWDRRRVTVRDRGGVPSVTTFERLRSMPLGNNQCISLIRCRLVTGRTHQIRVHLAAKGWPIVGDPVYGVAPPKAGPTTVTMGRQALHAWRLAFDHPRDAKHIEVVADIPADMRALLDADAVQE